MSTCVFVLLVIALPVALKVESGDGCRPRVTQGLAIALSGLDGIRCASHCNLHRTNRGRRPPGRATAAAGSVLIVL